LSEPYLVPQFIVDAMIADLKDLKRVQRKGLQNINNHIEDIEKRIKVLEAERVK